MSASSQAAGLGVHFFAAVSRPRSLFEEGQMIQTVDLKSKARTEFIDITQMVEDVVAAGGIDAGICLIHVPHTTAAVTVNENADPSVPADILTELNKIIPFDDGYGHMEGNSAAHIKSTLVGCSKSLIIAEGRLVLGRWQAVYFCEFDGPRHRRITVKLIGDH